MMVGLTATPKTDVDRNTYDFFEMENGVPTYAYDYETARDQDHVLVPYYNYEVKTEFQEKASPMINCPTRTRSGMRRILSRTA